MCMLTAFYPTRPLEDWEYKITRLFLTDLLVANATSNKDGVGFCTLDGNLNKWEQSAGAVAFERDFNQAVIDTVLNPFIAHVRATSTGAKAKEGAHPFALGNIALAHNGTFSGYRKLLETLSKDHNVVIDDKDPVDSHVFLHWLKVCMGDDTVLTKDHIIKALTDMTGSYALLIEDCEAGNLWVVPGTNPLHIAKVGPFFIVNTSDQNLKSATEYINGVADLMYGESWESTPVVRIAQHTINLLSSEGLKKVDDAPKMKVATVVHTGTTHYSRSYGYRGSAKVTRALSQEEAIKRASVYNQMVKLRWTYVRNDIDTACDILFESPWYMVNSSALEALLALFKEYEKKITDEAEKLWFGVCFGSVDDDNNTGLLDPYVSLGKFMDIQFPWMLNDLGTLREAHSMVATSKEGTFNE